MAQPRSRQELYNIIKNEVQLRAPQLTDFNEGSINDSIAGSASLAMVELVDLMLLKFGQTFFQTANGPEVTGGPDDLQTLAVDHFGEDFARPGATKAGGVVEFSRPTLAAGDVTIPLGTIVKTEPNANGVSVRFQTVQNLTMPGLTINASVEAADGDEGTGGNVIAGEVTVIESTLTDGTVVVTNPADFAGGEAQQDDATYRETILNLIEQLRGATKAALEARLLTVPGIVTATVIEFEQTVIEWNPATELPIGDSFNIPRVRAYIADANGVANDGLIESADLALSEVRACGVRVEVLSGAAVSLSWTAGISLNPGGPNYALFQTDVTLITDSMRAYIQALAIGDDFVKGLADQAILAIWGPSGTNDLVANGFVTTAPAGNVVTAENEKIVPGTMAIG